MLNFRHGIKLSFALLGVIFALSSGLTAAESKDDPYQQALTQLKNKNPQIRRQGAEAMGRIRNQGSIEPLKKLLSDDAPQVRSAAIESLGLMRAVAVSSDIARILSTDKEPAVRQMAAIALGYIADRNTVPALIKGLKDPHDGTRFASINSLGILRDDNAAEALGKELRSPDARVRGSCAFALGNIASKKSVPWLADAVKVSLATAPAANEGYLMDANVGASAIRSLGLIGDGSVVPLLKKYIDHKDKKVRINTAQALHRLGDKSGVTVARQLAGDTDGYNRRVSAEILSDLGDEKDLPALKKLKNDPDESVKQIATAAVERLTKKSAPAPAKTAPAKKSAAPAAKN